MDENIVELELDRALRATRNESGLPLDKIAFLISKNFDFAEQDYIIKTILEFR